MIPAPETTRLNTDLLSPLRPEVRAAIEAYIRRIVAAYADEVVAIILYGSQTRGEAEAESDIDLFV
jgi:predicted nucleotidyltransferase